MNTTLTMGSLFDGMGGFTVAGSLVGIKTLWASEIEPACIAVTENRLPKVKHYGDITKIDGSKLPPVDIICGGSPCQDLSIAGKQKGLEGERSGLFMEQIRIVKEMHKATNGAYPKCMVWENVPGAFSSNKGDDFNAILDEIANISESGVVISKPKKWRNVGAIVGDSWSIAWRVLDAQFWGVPQRRKRIFLVANFRNNCGFEILFKPESMLRYFEKGYEAWQGVTYNAKRSFIGSCKRRPENDGSAGFNGWKSHTGSIQYQHELAPTIEANMQPNVLQASFAEMNFDTYKEAEISTTLKHSGGNIGGGSETLIINAHGFKGGQSTGCIGYQREVSQTLSSNASGLEPTIVYALQANGIDRADTAGCNGAGWREDVSYTLNTVDKHGVVYAVENHPAVMHEEKDLQLASGNRATGTLMANAATKQWLGNQEAFSGNYHIIEKTHKKWIVRRLTPKECERLQGFPDDWTLVEYKNKPMSDSARYKMIGNSVAVPCVIYVLAAVRELIEMSENRKADET